MRGIVCPAESEAVAGVSVKAVSAGVSAATVSCADAACPVLAVAVIVETPAETPLAVHELPLIAAVATLVLELAQVESVAKPEPPVMLTANDVVLPTLTEVEVGEIDTTVGTTFTNPSPLPPQEVAVNAVIAHAKTR